SFFMSHCCALSHEDVFDSHAREDRAVAPGPAHALAALLLEHADLRPARLALDDRHDAGVGDERRTREDLAAVLFDEQHLFERQFGPRFADGAVYQHDAAGSDLQLTPAALDDRVHSLPLQETPSLALEMAQGQSVRRLLQQDAGSLDLLAAERVEEA